MIIRLFPKKWKRGARQLWQEEYGLDRPVRHARIDGGGAKRYIFTGIASLGLFLFPFGRPSGFTSVIHFGGLPRRFPCPRLLNPTTGQLLREHLRQQRGRLHRAGKAGKHIGQLCQAMHAKHGELAVRRILGTLALVKSTESLPPTTLAPWL